MCAVPLAPTHRQRALQPPGDPDGTADDADRLGGAFVAVVLRVEGLEHYPRRLGDLSRSTIWARFPRPVSLGARAVGWIEAEVDEWIRERIEKSRGAGMPGKEAITAS